MKQNKEIPAGYKDSPLGIIPKDWSVKRLGNIFSQIPTFSFSRDQMSGSEQKLRYVHYGDIHKINEIDSINLKCIELPFLNDGIIPEEKLEDDNFPYLQNGDILLTDASEDYDGIGKALEIIDTDNKKIIGGLHTIGLRNKTNELAIGFGRLIFKNGQSSKSLKRIAQGTKVYSISYNYIAKLHVILPPTEEQVKIVEILNCWNKAIEKQEQLVEKLERRKRALIQQLLSKKKRLPGFSSQWLTFELRQLCEFRNGKAHENDIDDKGNCIVVNSKFISSEGKIIKYTNANYSPLEKDEFAMVMSDVPNGKAIAKCFYIDQNNRYSLNQRICAFTAKSQSNSKFLYYVLNRNPYFLQFDDGAKQTNLRKDEILDCPIFCPNIDEQVAIAEVLTTADKELRMAKQKLILKKEERKSLLKTLLSGRIKVKI